MDNIFNKKYEEVPMQVYTPPIPEVYVQKLIDKGFGPPPFKEHFMSTSNYGAKCFLKGYEAG